jgi:hypothetical protein
MSRSAAAHAEHERLQRVPRAHAPVLPRRVSGAARAPRAYADARALAMSEAALVTTPVPRPRMPSRPPLRLTAGGASIALRVADATLGVTGSRTMDRLVRSRAWVVIVAFGLIGIVAMQVSMLKLNSGIGRAVEAAATLERRNAALRGDVSRLSMGDRIQALAGARGFVMPEPGDVTYLSAGSPGADGLRAAQRMRAPDPQLAGPASSVPVSGASAITGPAQANAAATDPAAAGATPGGAGAAGTAATPAATGAPAPATATAPVAAAGTPAPATAAGTVAAPAGTVAAPPATAAATAPAVASAGGVTTP